MSQDTRVSNGRSSPRHHAKHGMVLLIVCAQEHGKLFGMLVASTRWKWPASSLAVPLIPLLPAIESALNELEEPPLPRS
jgi:hypothetical protein